MIKTVSVSRLYARANVVRRWLLAMTSCIITQRQKCTYFCQTT